jgi:hypothetical protein
MLRVVADDKTRVELGSGLDELVAEGGRRMLAAAKAAEVDAYVSGLVDEVDKTGRQLVVRNGHAESSHIATGAARGGGRPRVNDCGSMRGPGRAAWFSITIADPKQELLCSHPDSVQQAASRRLGRFRLQRCDSTDWADLDGRPSSARPPVGRLVKRALHADCVAYRPKDHDETRGVVVTSIRSGYGRGRPRRRRSRDRGTQSRPA